MAMGTEASRCGDWTLHSFAGAAACFLGSKHTVTGLQYNCMLSGTLHDAVPSLLASC